MNNNTSSITEQSITTQSNSLNLCHLNGVVSRGDSNEDTQGQAAARSFDHLYANAKRIHAGLYSNIKLADSDASYSKVQAFIKRRYQTFFPAIAIDSVQHYVANSFVFYSEDNQGNIVSTASLMIDSASGFSEEPLFKRDIENYRQAGLNSLQIGRFVIDTQASSNAEAVTLKDYFKLFYLFSKQLGFDVVVGLIKVKDIAFHQKLLGAKILCPDTKINYGGEHNFAVAAWPLDNLDRRFFKWIGCKPMATTESKLIYPPQAWENYARAFAAVQTSFQRELQLASAALLSGDVADFGCGSAKLAPFLADKAEVTSYLGIDYSSEMIRIADWLISQFDCPTFTTYEGKIEEYQGSTFDSAVSLNSYYTWPEPIKVLQRIHSLLKPSGLFILATPNTELDMLAMEKEVRKELLTHPDFATFREINLQLTDNSNAHFITMDTLVRQLQSIGFALISCHQSFYLGGLNFLVLEKS